MAVNWNTPFNLGMPQQQQMPQPASLMTVLVQGEAGAQMYPVASGNTVLLMDFDTKTFWLKGTAANGVPQPMRKFAFDEVTPQPQPQQVDNSGLRHEIDELKQMVATLAATVAPKKAGGKANEQPAK